MELADFGNLFRLVRHKSLYFRCVNVTRNLATKIFSEHFFFPSKNVAGIPHETESETDNIKMKLTYRIVRSICPDVSSVSFTYSDKPNKVTRLVLDFCFPFCGAQDKICSDLDFRNRCLNPNPRYYFTVE